MMEEANDEQPEMVSHEEAVQAEKEATANISFDAKSPAPTLAAPSPLPAFLTPSSRASPPKVTPVSSIQATPVAPRTPVPRSTPPSATPPRSTPPSSTPPRSTPPCSTPIPVTTSIPPPTAAPEPPKIPHEGPSSLPASQDTQPKASQGLFGWISGHSLVNKVVEKTKSSMESVITTLDPGMKEIIYSGGDIEIAVTSTKDNKVVPVREAFQEAFGKATVTGYNSQATTAAQPVGYTVGMKGAEERISNLRKSGAIPEGQTIVSLEGFIVEILPDRWFEMTCLVLKDPSRGIDIQTFSQPTLVPSEYIQKAQDKTPADYPLRWAGLAATIGEVIEESEPHIGHTDWQLVKSGVSRRESLALAAKALAYMYKERLPTSFIS